MSPFYGIKMKKIIFLIVGIIYTLTCLGQQIVLSDAVNISLPARAEKLSKEQVSSFTNKRFKNDKIALNTIANTHTPHLYKVDNVFISFFTSAGNTEENHLVK